MIKEYFKNKFATLVLVISSYFRKKKSSSTITGIVFSKDRPGQLDALIQSYKDNVQNLAPLIILYYASDKKYQAGYDKLIDNYQEFEFIKEKSFKKDLIRSIRKIKSKSVFFLVDDILFTRKFDINQLSSLDLNSYVVSMRLGSNITYSYIQDREIIQPSINRLNDDIIWWNWIPDNSYWSYPVSVDGHFFLKNEILLMLHLSNFNNPNSLEYKLQKFNEYFSSKRGASINMSVLVNFPWNKVQTENSNKSGDISSEKLLNYFMEGKMINHNKYFGKVYNSCHVEEELYI